MKQELKVKCTASYTNITHTLWKQELKVKYTASYIDIANIIW